MKKGINKLAFLGLLMMGMTPVFGQSPSNSNHIFFYGLIVLGVLLLLWAVVSIANSLMQIEAKKVGVDTQKNNMSLFPGVKEVLGGATPAFAKEVDFISLKKGHDIKLDGAVNSSTVYDKFTSLVSISPYDFRGLSPIPKVLVEKGDEVVAGQVLFFDKKNPDIKYVSPVSGEIVDVLRGEKRSISNIIILADKETKAQTFELPNMQDRDALVSFLAESGLWVGINERPFDVVPDLDSQPKNIFISTFDTAPLAPDSSVVIAQEAQAFAKGVEVLSNLTTGKVHIGLNGNAKTGSNFQLVESNNVQNHYVKGPHPAGNVGIQIHHIDPIGASSKVWTLHYQEVIRWGKMFLTGHYDGTRIVALTGAELVTPQYVRTFQGAKIDELLQGNLTNDHIRIISGDVLSGSQKEMASFMAFQDDQITVVKENDNYEFLGWILPITPRPSVSRTFPNFLYPNHKFEAETNTHGEERAFVVTGQYEKVLPMDIYPQHLMKAIMTEDFEKMEGLGINELSEEDIALCEFVCTSKAPLQQILREGLDLVRAQG